MDIDLQTTFGKAHAVREMNQRLGNGSFDLDHFGAFIVRLSARTEEYQITHTNIINGY
jgi:hypothetical protein